MVMFKEKALVMERQLPDFLGRFITNYAVSKDVIGSLRKSSVGGGELNEGVACALKNLLRGIPLEEAFLPLASGDSKWLARVFNLVMDSLKDGRNITSDLQKLQEDLLDIGNMRRRRNARNMLNILLILAGISIIFPVVCAVGIRLGAKISGMFGGSTEQGNNMLFSLAHIMFQGLIASAVVCEMRDSDGVLEVYIAELCVALPLFFGLLSFWPF